MATISRRAWLRYIGQLRQINNKAAEEMIKYRASVVADVEAGTLTGNEARKLIVDHAYAVATGYGEASAAVACEMYDAVAAMEGASVPAAVPARTATYGETAKAVYGTMNQNPEEVPATVSRLVKQAGADTTVQNAIRDGAEWAWIPNGDTCAFCITLASQGWMPASKDQLDGSHAEHIHANCDCTFAIRFDGDSDVAGYEPDEYLKMYKDADPGGNSQAKINALRRQFYEENKEQINAQKRDAYEKRKERESSEAEELNV